MISNKINCTDISGDMHEVDSRQLSFRPSVYAIIINDNQILLSRQREGYDLPGGGIELGETIEQALIREVKEETGLLVKIGNIVACRESFFKLPHVCNFVHSILMYYLCNAASGELSTEFLDGYEQADADKPEWVDLAKIENIKFNSSINIKDVIQEAMQVLKKS